MNKSEEYLKISEEIVNGVGGMDNIQGSAHCATRLRFNLKDESVVDGAKVAKIPGVITTVQAGGQYQIVIGNHHIVSTYHRSNNRSWR